MATSPDAVGVVRQTVFINGSKLDDSVELVSVSIDKRINRIASATIVLLDGDMPGQDFPVSNTDDFKPGTEIKINAGYGDEEETVFQGIVVKHGLKISGDNFARLVVECRDKAVSMTVGRKNANYVESKDSDVISKLIGNHSGLSADVAATDTTHAELVQYYCTDWDFMLSRAEVNGLLVIVDEGKVSVQPPQVNDSPVLKVSYGHDLIEFDADIDARTQLAEVKGVSWDPKNQQIVAEQSQPKKLNEQGNLDAAELAKVVGLDSFRLQSVAPMEKTALSAWADGQQIKAGLARIRGQMKFQGSAKAKPGSLIELTGVGERFSGRVFVSAVRHELERGQWLTEVAFGMSPDWFAEQRDLISPPASGLVPGVEGLQIGIVKKLDEDPEKQHRIQVSVPLLEAETEGVWARLAEFYASAGVGAFFVPEIGDEVLLGYLNNDPAHPVILGSLYSSKQNPPYDLTAENYTKAVVTKGELRLELDDDKKVITLITPGKSKIVISDDEKSILLQDQNDNKVELGTSGITLESPKDIKISAKGKVTVDAAGEIGISSKADVNVAGLNINNNANAGFVAKGSASAELSASGQTTVKGAMVMIN